jgi:hypothetical protein
MNKVGRDGVDDDGDGAVEKWGADGAIDVECSQR